MVHDYVVPTFVWDRLLFSNPDSRQREKVRGVFSSPDSNIEFEHHTGKLKYRDFLKLLACYICIQYEIRMFIPDS